MVAPWFWSLSREEASLRIAGEGLGAGGTLGLAVPTASGVADWCKQRLGPEVRRN